MSLHTVEPPDNIDAYQNNFNYLMWAPNTTVELCCVPWDSAYRNVVRFDSERERTEYFDSLQKETITITKATYCAWGQPVRINLPFNKVNRFNYLRVTNRYDFLDDVRTYYYFIQDVQYIAPNTTQLMIMLDVFQQFVYSADFGRCYIERGHIGVANRRQFEKYGRGYLDTPEGLDTGGVMATQDYEYTPLYGTISSSENGKELTEVACTVIVVSNTKLEGDHGTESNPKLESAEGSTADEIANGSAVYMFYSTGDFVRAMKNLSAYPWVTQGVTSVYMTPTLGILETYKGSVDGSAYVEIGGVNASKLVTKSGLRDNSQKYTVKNFREHFDLPDRYRNLKKFLTYPYAVIQASLQNGQNLMLQPELVDGDNLEYMQMTQVAPPSPRFVYYINNYNNRGRRKTTQSLGDRPTGLKVGGKYEWKGTGVTIENGDYLDTALTLTDFPQGTILNNNAALILASHANSIAYQYSTADWANQKTQMGIQQALAQTAMGNELSQNMTAAGNANRTSSMAISQQAQQISNDISNELAKSQTNLNAMTTGVNALAGGIGDIATGRIGSGIGTIVGAGMEIGKSYAATDLNISASNRQLANSLNAQTQQTALANSYANHTTALQTTYNTNIADMNASYARAAAKGDYANTIAGINAKIQDTKLTPPSTAGQLGGATFNHANSLVGIMTKFKQISSTAMSIIGEYWLRYGYYVQRFATPPKNLACMRNFTYWKMQEANIAGLIPEEYRQTLRGIFEKGVTVWRHPEHINTLDIADNEPLPDIEY